MVGVLFWRLRRVCYFICCFVVVSVVFVFVNININIFVVFFFVMEVLWVF